MRLLFILVFSCAAVCANEERILRRIDAFCQIGDYESAATYAEMGLRRGNSEALSSALISALARQGKEKEALRLYRQLGSDHPDLLEEISWATIRSGSQSHSLMHRLYAMVGAVATHDVQAIPLLTDVLESPHPLLRTVALELASQMRDLPLQRQVERLLESETAWEARLTAIQAAGRLQMKDLRPYLERRIASDSATAEERSVAIEAVVVMTDAADGIDLERLSADPRAGLRHLACDVIAHLELEETALLVRMLDDPRPDVRAAALFALGYLRSDCLDAVVPLLDDPDDRVAITAAWVYTILADDPSVFERHLRAESKDIRRLAAAALAKTGAHGVPLMRAWFDTHSDPYVCGNLAIGLLGQREETKAASGVLYELLTEIDERWMWQEGPFRMLAPSTVAHNTRIPNAPEVANQLTRLEVLGMLAIVEHPKALDALKQFLEKRTWGVTGVAAMTLLGEGDESVLDLIRELLQDPDANIRAQAALGLAIWGKDAEAITTLQETYTHADRELKIKILEAIGHIGSPDSLPFLVKTLDEPFLSLRIIAASSIIQCLNS